MTHSADLAAETIVHLARVAQSGGGAHRLTAAQWTALRFFARANRLSRTPSAFSEFHATTRGTASQTVKSLVALGLLERHRNEDDGRSVRFDLTPSGRAALAEDPLQALSAALGRLGDAERARLVGTLQGVASNLAASRDSPMFGTCNDCAHCEPAQDTPAYCRCAAASLAAVEMDALCIQFRPRDESPPARDVVN
jgi:DNA-binding MarR family transcriptional regulator